MLIKETNSICPECLQSVPARVVDRDSQVWMQKTCPEHGEFEALLSASRRHYHEQQAPASAGSCCGNSCGSGPGDAASGPWTQHSCTVLIEIIERCNLSCPTCFAGSSPQHSGQMPMAEFRRQVDQLSKGGKQAADMIQLSGGEPTIHPRLFDMVEYLFENGFRHVTINSNGIKLAQAPFTQRLAEISRRFDDVRLFVYLQFDGFDEDTHEALRGRADLLDIKRRALRNCHDHGISVHPVMTLTRGINDHEVGAFVELARENPDIRNVVIQPAMYSGRYDNPRRQDRLTLADTVALVCEQFGHFGQDDFMPIPCSDPNCFGFATALRLDKALLPVSRYFPAYEEWGEDDAGRLIEQFTDTINGPDAIGGALGWAGATGRLDQALESLDGDTVEELLDLMTQHQAGELNLWDRLLTISIKPFMDAWTYDQDRIDQCCVHILDPEGNPVSFCEYNAIQRPQMNGQLPQTIKVMNA